MKKILITLYFGCVIALSLSARAEAGDAQLQVETMELNRFDQIIEIAGNFGVPCVKNATPYLTTTKEDGTLRLAVRGERTSAICIQVVGPRIALAVDTKALKHEIEKLGLDSNRPYRIVHPETGFNELIDFGGEMLPFEFSTASIEGTLIQENGKFFIQLNEKKTEISSPFIELAPLVGQTAEVLGHQLQASQSFLLSKNANSRFILTGVSIAVE